MSQEEIEEIQHELAREAKPKTLIIYVSAILSILALAGYVGNIWVYKDRQDTLSNEVKEIRDDRRHKSDDYEEYKRQRSAWEAQMSAFVQTQATFNTRIQNHIDDRAIHSTQEQINSAIASQIQPMSLAIKEIQVTLPGQQKQLDRMEGLMNQVLTNMQEDRVRGKDGK